MSRPNPSVFARGGPAYSPPRPIHPHARTASCPRRRTRCQARDLPHLTGVAIAVPSGKSGSPTPDVSLLGRSVPAASPIHAEERRRIRPDMHMSRDQVRGHRPVVRLLRRCTSAGQGPGSARRRQRGSVTAETAVAFPALVVVLAIALWGVSAAAAQVACVDAARAGARAAARGEPQSEVRAAVLRAAPPGSHVSLNRDPATTRVIVQAEARPPLKGLFPALKLNAQATAATEPEEGKPMP